MTTPLELAYRNAGLEPTARRHLERLMASWSLLADLCFSDLLLYVSADRLAGGEAAQGNTHFVAIGQVRPTTNPTLFEIDLVGQVVTARQLPLVLEALRTGAISIGRPHASAKAWVLRSSKAVSERAACR